MKRKLNKCKKVVLYGVGTKSYNIYKILHISGYSIAYCVVTNDSVEKSDFEDVKVYPFMKKKDEIIRQGYQLVIAVGVNYEKDIIKNIKDNGINEFWTRSDMPWNVDFETYKDLDTKGYYDIIKTKYLSNIDEYKKNDEIRNFVNKGIKKEVNNKKILFLLLHITARAYKIINALHKRGYIVDIIIWMNSMRLTDKTCDEYSRISEHCILSCDSEEVMMYCAATNAKILHIFSHADTDLALSQVLINGKRIFPKIVFDEYDVYTEMRNLASEPIINAELFCLKNADGLCNRYTCMEYLEEKGYEICKNRIYFMDCCNDDTNYISPQKTENDDINLVYAGTVITDETYEGIKCNKFLEFGELCRNKHVHFHLYPISYNQARLNAYISMEKENPYFHIHYPVPHYKLPQEISKYDYGVISATNEFLHYGDILHTKAVVSYCAMNKLFDFLEAGLPIISAFPTEQVKIFERDGVLIRKTDEEIDFDELRQRRNEMKKRVVEVRDKYRVSNQLPKLIEFYDSL